MARQSFEEWLTQPEVERIGNYLLAKIAAYALPARWVTPAAYAKHYGITTMTLWRRREFLSSKGAAMGKGKSTRYDITVAPSGERILKLN